MNKTRTYWRQYEHALGMRWHCVYPCCRKHISYNLSFQIKNLQNWPALWFGLRRDGSFTSVRSRQQWFVFNINARTQHSPSYFNALNSLSYGLKLGSLTPMCLFTPGWLIQDKYCIQIIVWKKSRSPFYHNGDPRGSRKTLLHCYAHFTDFRGGITNFPLGIHRCLRITSSPWVPRSASGE